MYRPIISIAVAGLPLTIGLADEVPDAGNTELDGYLIGEVMLDKADVFDLSNPDENNWLYRAANRFHIITRDRVIAKQLLFKPGDAFDQQVIDESERIHLRRSYRANARGGR